MPFFPFPIVCCRVTPTYVSSVLVWHFSGIGAYPLTLLHPPPTSCPCQSPPRPVLSANGGVPCLSDISATSAWGFFWSCAGIHGTTLSGWTSGLAGLILGIRWCNSRIGLSCWVGGVYTMGLELGRPGWSALVSRGAPWANHYFSAQSTL